MAEVSPAYERPPMLIPSGSGCSRSFAMQDDPLSDIKIAKAALETDRWQTSCVCIIASDTSGHRQGSGQNEQR